MKPPKNLNKQYADQCGTVEDIDFVPFVTVGGHIDATIGLKLGGVWYYADGYRLSLAKFERDDVRKLRIKL